MTRSLKTTLAATLACAAIVLASSTAQANILINPGFDDDARTGSVGNKLNVSVTGWSTDAPDGSGFNNILVDGSTPYGGGPNSAQSGFQYLDLHGSADPNALWQTFTLPTDSDLTFSAYYSNREGGDGGRAADLGIYNAAGTTRLSSLVTVDLSGDSMPSTSWTQSPIGGVSLSAGTYQVRTNMDGFLNIDSVVVDASPGGPGPTSLSFQEGVSPTPAYVADNTWLRSGTNANTPQDDDSDDETIVGFSGTEMRPMFEFDLTEIETAAAGNPFTIDSVQLVVTSRGDNLGTTPLNLDLHEYEFPFVESLATWNNPDGVAGGDTTPGGTLGAILQSLGVADPSAIGMGDTVTLADSAAFRTAVENALTAGDNTLRLLLRGDATSGTKFIRFYDETFGTRGFRPGLVVDFTVADVIPEPATLSLLGLGALLALRRRRRSR